MKDKMLHYLRDNGFVPMKTNIEEEGDLILTRYYINNQGALLYKSNGVLRIVDTDIPDKDGYKRVNLLVGGKSMMKFIHRLVAQNFIPNPYPKTRTCVNHKNKNIHDNSVENLEWVSVSENAFHASRTRHLNKPRTIYPILQIGIMGDNKCFIVNRFENRRSLPNKVPTSIHKVDKQYILACCDNFRYKHTYRNYYWVYEKNLNQFLKTNSFVLINAF